MAIRITITIFVALLLYPLRCGYDTRAWNKLHGVFGSSFLRPPKKTENTTKKKQNSCFVSDVKLF
jgi:hypothetical protein